ncbi:golgin subfamily A member 5 isoform X1 [Hydra vulgaris]|uniref:golgin subfamily A member 5 isoform X1 n=1 Tax=Hydra vulgaris TaxID=6087 RepID=UPI0006417C42|nr:golgin subfamily A member 5 isoform X1 [Hydra vulgaris]
MSWLSEITSKAEIFLNKIDQSAAITLNNESLTHEKNESYNKYNIKDSPQLSPINNTFSENDGKRTNLNMLNLSVDDKIHTANKLHNDAISQSNLMRSTSTPSLIKQDEMLFQFLNSSQPSEKSHRKSHSGPKVSHNSATLRKSSLTDTISSEVIQSYVPLKSNLDNKLLDSVKVSTGTEKTIKEVNVMHATEKNNSSGAYQNKELLTNLELENKLLKNELSVLNEELALNLQRLQKQKDETEMYQKRYENRRNQQNEDYERIRKDFEAREADMQEALKAKDSQLAVLRVRIQEVDLELKDKIQTLALVESQNEKLLKDHKDAYGFHGDALQKLQLKLEETEQEFHKTQHECNKLKEELINMQAKFQNEQIQSTEIIKQLQAKQNDEKVKLLEYELKVKHSEETACQAQNEFAEYKEKAARILQAKEKLINSLKQGVSSSDSQLMLFSELESLKQERDLLSDEIKKNTYTIEQLRSEYHDLEMVHNEGREETNDRIESLQMSLQEEIQKRNNAEDDMKRYMQELHFVRDELHKTKISNVSLIQQYDAEINRLQQQLVAKRSVSSSEEELENRLRTLTENLIHKQTTIEALGTEKNSLVLQLERLEKQYADVQNSLVKRSKANQQNDFDDLEAGSHIASISSVMPSQITRNQHWKKTVNTIDKISIQLGVFLRRYPTARLMVVIYMIILHIWVTFVLLTYTPEIH